MLEDGSIDFKERGIITEITQGQDIGKYFAGQEKKDGMNVYGEVIEGELKQKGARIGSNLYVDGDEEKVVKSSVNGFYVASEKEVNVEETLFHAYDGFITGDFTVIN